MPDCVTKPGDTAVPCQNSRVRRLRTCSVSKVIDDGFSRRALERAVAGTFRSESKNPCRRGPAIALVVDAGPLFAYVDGDDRQQAAGNLIAAAERLGIGEVATLDRRAFPVEQSRLGGLARVP